MLTFAEQLEQQARDLVKHAENKQGRSGRISALERELALTVSHIESARDLHANLRRGLLRQECYLDTEIMQREPREPVYDDPRLPERDKLRDRLRDVDKERRRLALQENETLRNLNDRLLTGLNRTTPILD